MNLSTSQRPDPASAAEADLPEASLPDELSEEATRFLEEQIPDMAAGAGKLGFWRALSQGAPVVCAEGDALWEISPDGSRRFLKPVEAGRDIAVGTRFEVR